MYRISITRKLPLSDPPDQTVEVYAQSFEELDVAAVISLLNKKTRVRGPRKKKEPKP